MDLTQLDRGFDDSPLLEEDIALSTESEGSFMTDADMEPSEASSSEGETSGTENINNKHTTNENTLPTQEQINTASTTPLAKYLSSTNIGSALLETVMDRESM